MKTKLLASFIFAILSSIVYGQNNFAFYEENELIIQLANGHRENYGKDLKIIDRKLAKSEDKYYITSFTPEELRKFPMTEGMVFFQGIKSPHNEDWIFLERNTSMENIEYNLCFYSANKQMKKILFNQDTNPLNNRILALKPIAWGKDKDIILLEAFEFGSVAEHEGIWEYNISNGKSRKLKITSSYMTTPELSLNRNYLIYTGTSEDYRDQLDGLIDQVYTYELGSENEKLVYKSKSKYITLIGWVQNLKYNDLIDINTPDTNEEINNQSASSLLVPSVKFPFSSGSTYCITRTVQNPIIGSPCGSFCQNSEYGHNGFAVDFGMPNNTNVLAAAGGTVVWAKFSTVGYGNLVKIRHNDNTIAYYAHLNAIGVKVNDVVSQGCIIGKSGKSGCSSGPHLHMEIRDASDNQKQTFTVIDCNNQIPRSEYYATSSNVQNTCTSNFNLNCITPTLINIANGVPYQGTTLNGNSTVNSYTCNNWTDFGPEIVHRYSHTGGNLSATLTHSLNIDLDVFILSSCNASNCVGTVYSNSAVYNNAPSGIYYIVVDGSNTANSLYNCGLGSHYGHYGSYTLTVTSSGVVGCTTPGRPENVSGTPTGQTNANLSWEPGNPSGSPVVTYYWVVGTSPTVTYGNGVAQGYTTSTSAATSALSCNTTYYLRVYAYTSCNGTQSNYRTSSSFTTSACGGACLTCPSYDFSLNSTTSWQTHSNSILTGGCKKYRISMDAGKIYYFSTCTNDGGSSNFDTYFKLYNSSCSSILNNDDYCGYQSYLTYTPSSSGYYYFEVNSCCTGYSGGSYKLAYKYSTGCTTPERPENVSGTPTGQTNANLSWEPGNPPGSPVVTYYWVVGTSPTVTYGNGVAQGYTTSTSAATSALSCNTTYYLRVYAYTSCNGTQSNYRTSSAFTTSACGGTCLTCPSYDFSLNPTTSWQTHSNSIAVGGCKKYRIYMYTGITYFFSTCPIDGGSANFDTYFKLYNSNCFSFSSNDDFCNYQSFLTFTPSTSGYYYFEVNSCCIGNYGGNYKLAYRYSSYGAIISPNDEESSFSVYPNPTSKDFLIDFNLKEKSEVVIKLYNQFGILVYKRIDDQQNSGKNSILIETSQFSSGIYFLEIHFNDKVVNSKLIITK